MTPNQATASRCRGEARRALSLTTVAADLPVDVPPLPSPDWEV